MEHVILVDANDEEIGAIDKMEAHQQGLLHRAFSVLLFNKKGEMMIQKRARTKYHSGGLWSNACCSHPRPGEKMQDAVCRRLHEELGIALTPTFSYKFIYRIEFENKLIENEYDHVYVGTFEGTPLINTLEVEDYKFISERELREHMKENPDQYTYWFKLIVESNTLTNFLK